MLIGDQWAFDAELFFRNVAGGHGTMILGVCRERLLAQGAEEGENGIFVPAITTVAVDRVFDAGDIFHGLRADQILTSLVPVEKLKEVPEKRWQQLLK